MNESALEQTDRFESSLMKTVELAAEAVVITDTDAVIQYVNPAFERITGYSRDEVLGQNPNILQSGRQDPAFYEGMWKTLLNGETWTGLFVNRKKDDSVYTERASISAVKDASGQIVNYVAVKRDVSHELELAEQLRQARKMQSIGQMVGGVAHDFNNLVQIINGYAGVARTKLSPDHEAGKSIEEIALAGAQAKKLVRQLLAFSRQQVIEPTDLSLNEEIDRLLNMLGRLIGEHVRLEFIPGDVPDLIFSDQGQIQQVLMNLCANARDAMPDGGSLVLRTESVSIELGDIKTARRVRPGRYVMLSVADTGDGMSEEICKHIYEPFFTTKEKGVGTGLGMSTVYGIVKQNEGYIEVHSKPGEGAEFKIYLPVSRPLNVALTAPAAARLAPVEEGVETILVVEDDAVLLNLAVELLSDAGYTTFTAKNGLEAVQVFEEHIDEIDMVMADVVMPQMGGRELMEEILKRRSSVRYMYVSGYNPDTGYTDFIKKQGSRLLNKPYTEEELLHIVRQVLDED